jgi:hypothetical protein
VPRAYKICPNLKAFLKCITVHNTRYKKVIAMVIIFYCITCTMDPSKILDSRPCQFGTLKIEYDKKYVRKNYGRKMTYQLRRPYSQLPQSWCPRSEFHPPIGEQHHAGQDPHWPASNTFSLNFDPGIFYRSKLRNVFCLII